MIRICGCAQVGQTFQTQLEERLSCCCYSHIPHPVSEQTMMRNISNSLCSSLALGIHLAATILYWFNWTGCVFPSPRMEPLRGMPGPERPQTDCGSAGEADRLCLSEMACSSPHCCSYSSPPPPPPGWAASGVCSIGELKETTSHCSNYQSRRAVLMGLTNLLSDSLFCLSFCPSVLLSPQKRKHLDAPLYVGLWVSNVNVTRVYTVNKYRQKDHSGFSYTNIPHFIYVVNSWLHKVHWPCHYSGWIYLITHI